MEKELSISDDTVISKIYYIRKQKVMLDIDLAILYHVETRSLKQAAKRNILRFPDDFMFQLTKQEWQEVITICDNLPLKAKYSPVIALEGVVKDDGKVDCRRISS